MRINSKFLFSALLCVFACNTQSADAQFLKKLGKGLGKFLDAAAAISTSDDDNNSTPANSSSRSTAAANYNVRATLVGVHRYAKGVRITYTLTNTSQKHIKAYCYKVTANFGKGSQEGCWYVMGLDQQSGGSYDSPACVLYPGIPVKCEAYFSDVASSSVSASNICVEAAYVEGRDNNTAFSDTGHPCMNDNNISSTKIVGTGSIQPLQPTNFEGCTYSNPDISLQVKSVARTPKGVNITFSVKNVSSRIIDLSLEQNAIDSKKVCTVYDENGTVYESTYFNDDYTSLTFQGYKEYGQKMFRLRPNESNTVSLTLKKIPASVKSLSLVNILLSDVNLKAEEEIATFVKFKNLPIK